MCQPGWCGGVGGEWVLASEWVPSLFTWNYLNIVHQFIHQYKIKSLKFKIKKILQWKKKKRWAESCSSNTQPHDFSDLPGQRFSSHPSCSLQVFRGLCPRLSSSETLAPTSGASSVLTAGEEPSRTSHTSRSLCWPRSEMHPICPQPTALYNPTAHPEEDQTHCRAFGYDGVLH